MRKSTRHQVILLLCLLPMAIFAQENQLYRKIKGEKQAGTAFTTVTGAFSKGTPSQILPGNFIRPAEVTFLQFSKSSLSQLSPAVTLALPFHNKTLQLELLEVPASFYNYTIQTSDGQRLLPNRSNKHYRGIIAGDTQSVVALTFAENKVFGVIANKEGNYNLVPDKQSGRLMLYNDKNLVKKPDFNCGTKDTPRAEKTVTLNSLSGLTTHIRCTRLYFETEFDIFQAEGSVAAVETYVTGLYNQVATLYQNENLSTTISEIFVWTTADPYTATGTGSLLAQFQAQKTTINGDLGHLLTYRAIGGGEAAGFNGLCNPDVDQQLAVSGIDPFFAAVPTYSWPVYVVTHEFGHLFGSQHTHACVWNGNNTAIDGCAGYTEIGSCSLPGSPGAGGTIMSYCHQTTGINFGFGFGPQPGDRIRDKVANATCLTMAGPISGPQLICAAENYTFDNFPSGATVNWAVAPTGIATISGSGAAITLTRSGSASGLITLTGTIPNNCPGGFVEQSIYVGVPQRPKFFDEMGTEIRTITTCVGEAKSIFVENHGLEDVLEYEWEKVTGDFIFNASGNMGTVLWPMTDNGVVSVRARNACGWGPLTLYVIRIVDCAARTAPLLVKVFPNPVQDNMRVVVQPAASAGRQANTQATETYTASLYNTQGQQVKQGVVRNGQVMFQTRSLPEGIYFLHVQAGTHIIKKQVMIKH